MPDVYKKRNLSLAAYLLTWRLQQVGASFVYRAQYRTLQESLQAQQTSLNFSALDTLQQNIVDFMATVSEKSRFTQASATAFNDCFYVLECLEGVRNAHQNRLQQETKQRLNRTDKKNVPFNPPNGSTLLLNLRQARDDRLGTCLDNKAVGLCEGGVFAWAAGLLNSKQYSVLGVGPDRALPVREMPLILPKATAKPSQTSSEEKEINVLDTWFFKNTTHPNIYAPITKTSLYYQYTQQGEQNFVSSLQKEVPLIKEESIGQQLAFDDKSFSRILKQLQQRAGKVCGMLLYGEEETHRVAFVYHPEGQVEFYDQNTGWFLIESGRFVEWMEEYKKKAQWYLRNEECYHYTSYQLSQLYLPEDPQATVKAIAPVSSVSSQEAASSIEQEVQQTDALINWTEVKATTQDDARLRVALPKRPVKTKTKRKPLSEKAQQALAKKLAEFSEGYEQFKNKNNAVAQHLMRGKQEPLITTQEKLEGLKAYNLRRTPVTNQWIADDKELNALHELFGIDHATWDRLPAALKQELQNDWNKIDKNTQQFIFLYSQILDKHSQRKDTSSKKPEVSELTTQLNAYAKREPSDEIVKQLRVLPKKQRLITLLRTSLPVARQRELIERYVLQQDWIARLKYQFSEMRRDVQTRNAASMAILSEIAVIASLVIAFKYLPFSVLFWGAGLPLFFGTLCAVTFVPTLVFQLAYEYHANLFGILKPTQHTAFFNFNSLVEIDWSQYALKTLMGVAVVGLLLGAAVLVTSLLVSHGIGLDFFSQLNVTDLINTLTQTFHNSLGLALGMALLMQISVVTFAGAGLGVQSEVAANHDVDDNEFPSAPTTPQSTDLLSHHSRIVFGQTPTVHTLPEKTMGDSGLHSSVSDACTEGFGTAPE